MGEHDNYEVDDVAALFENLQETTRIGLFRKKPTYAAGYLTTIEMSPGEMLDLEQIKLDWGGGEIQFRPMVQTPRGARWAAGGRTIKLTGEPRERGVIHPLAGVPSQVRGGIAPTPGQPVRDHGPYALIQQLLERDRERDRQHAELVAEIRASRRGGVPLAGGADPLGGLLGQIRQLRQLQAELDPHAGDEEEAPPRETTQDRMSSLLFGLLEKKLESEGKLPPTQQQQPRRAVAPRPAAPMPPPDAPPLASGWRLHAAPAAGPRAAAPPAPPAPPAPGVAPTADEIVALLASLDAPTRMEVLGRSSAYLSKDDVMNWISSNGDDEEAEAVAT